MLMSEVKGLSVLRSVVKGKSAHVRGEGIKVCSCQR